MKYDIFELIQKLEGSIEPCAETHVDEKHLANLKEWCELHRNITKELFICADNEELRKFYSAGRIIDYARSYLRDVQDDLDNFISTWNEQESKNSKKDDVCF